MPHHTHTFSTHTELAKHISGKSRRELVSCLDSRDPRVRMAANAAGGSWADIRALLAARSLGDGELCAKLSQELGQKGTIQELLCEVAKRDDSIYLPIKPNEYHNRPVVLLRQKPEKKGPRSPYHKWYGWWLAWAKDDVGELSEAGWSIPEKLPIGPVA